MNKRLLLTSFAFSIVLVVSAQELDVFNKERLDMNRKGMLVLGTWAVSNIALSPIMAGRTEGSTKYFHQMNGYWNGVNLVLAGIGYYTATTTDPSGMTLAQTLKEQHSIEKILLFNAGLDLAYIAGGFYLKERAKNGINNSDRLKGFGQSLILQGGFLFAFDVAFYLFHKSHATGLYQFVDQLAISPGGFSMRWYF